MLIVNGDQITVRAAYPGLRDILANNNSIGILGRNNSGRTLLCKALVESMCEKESAILYHVKDDKSILVDVCQYEAFNTKQLEDLVSTLEEDLWVVVDDISRFSEEELRVIAKTLPCKVIFSGTSEDWWYTKGFDVEIELTGKMIVLPEDCLPIEQLIREYGNTEEE